MNTGERFVHGVEDAICRRPVQAEVDMDSVFLAQLYGAIDGRNFVFANFQEILRVGPEPVIHRQTDPVETPIANSAKVVLLEHAVILIGEI